MKKHYLCKRILKERMKTTLILVGKTTDRHIAALTDEYVGRLQHYAPFDIVVIPELKNTKSLSETQQKQAEGVQILRQIQTGDHVVLLDEHGKQPTSVQLAAWLEKKQATARHLVFVIGGPYGFSSDVYARANEQLSLSPLTFSHQMVRPIFVEQLYRAHTIIKGEPYHHE